MATDARNLHFVQYTLNNGEVSYRYESRGDHAKYAASCYKMENFFPLTIGGAKYRPGTAWVATLADVARPIAFIFNKLESYVLVFSHLSLAIYNVDGTPVTTTPTLTTVFPATILSRLYVFQSADVMYICSGDFAVYKLSRIADQEFEITEVFFYAPGTVLDEPTGTDLGAGTLTPGATTGNGVTFTLQNAVTVAADLGRIIVYRTSRAVITAVGASTYTADIISPFPNTSAIPATDWRLTGSPDGTLNPVTSHVKGNIITIDFSVANAIRTIDIGKYLAFYGGFVRITKIVSTTRIQGTIVSELKDITPGVGAPATPIWTIWRPAWTSALGFPTCGTFFQGRMFLGRDITVWGSITADIENFALGSGDDDGINKAITDDEVNDLRWIVATNRLFFGTIGGVYTATASSDGGPLTSNDFNIQHVSNVGAEEIKPVRANGQIVSIQFGARDVRELAFDLLDNQTKSPNLIALADHITEFNQIQGVVYSQDPYSLLLAPLDTGQIAVMAYNRDEQLAGWCRWITPNGCFIDLCVVPFMDTGRDRIFAVVERNAVWTLEYFDTETQLSARQWQGLYTDGAITFTGNLAPSFVLTGLDHLEGLTVIPIGNGFLYDPVVVSGGQAVVTPQIDADDWEIGLQFPGKIQPLEPQIPQQAGAPWTIRGWSEVGARIRQTLGIELGVVVREEEKQISQNINFRKQTHDPLTQLPPQRGKVCAPAQAHDGVNRMVLLQNRPFPAEILGLFGLLEIGDRPKCETFDEPAPIPACNPPTPGGGGVCPGGGPTEPTVSHIDSGFTLSPGMNTFVLDQVTDPDNPVAYSTTGFNQNNYVQKWDMLAIAIEWEITVLPLNAQWQAPGIDYSNGDLYIQESFGPTHAVVQLDPADGSEIRRSANFSASQMRVSQGIKVTSDSIYGIFSSPTINIVWALNKSDLSLRWTTPTLGTSVGSANRIGGLAIDGDENPWVTVGDTTRVGLIAVNATTGAGTLHDLSASFTPTGLTHITYDPTNDALVIYALGNARRWDFSDSTLHDLGFQGLQAANDNQNIVDGTAWVNNSNRIEEYDIATGALLQTVFKVDMVGTTVLNWFDLTMMTNLNCLFTTHQSILGGTQGGAGRICLPCPEE